MTLPIIQISSIIRNSSDHLNPSKTLEFFRFCCYYFPQCSSPFPLPSLPSHKMASSSLGNASTGNNGLLADEVARLSIQNVCNRPLIGARPCALAIGNHSRSRWTTARISAAPTMAMSAMSNGWENQMTLELYEAYDKERGKSDFIDGSERLDEWMRDSVTEIVKNLREAPLLVQVYPKRKNNPRCCEMTTLATEKRAVVEGWPVLKKKWEAGETPSPEGVIFVGELAGEEADEGRGKERTTRVWGLVVQGKGVGCGPVCYLLKTTSVEAGTGLGLRCTYFCLVRTENFWESAESQLKNSWLLRSQ